ncbi:M10 family metallopeptidase C-terminal domain-containing protein [Alsobacter sp. SYSU M60028]|uniref:M10 family metallopeptidase C-terminal domain-containing protein n=1 Tax=Alsobacter ponti TaxID=2962936 RepID=A0ABT1LHW8_9HYPH|nr:M10 family metallopeptidase C-terminal domain-containing protein [Alsobacter ponti]MCP8941044.1 M10 family metallopeptidase C-terminal domain-containing protein [Alsobacter ponti]
MAGPESVSLTGNLEIDALLTGYKWDTSSLTYSFPDSGWDYVLEQFFDLATPEQLAEFAALTVLGGPEAAITEHFLSVITVGVVALNGFEEFNDAQKASARFATAQMVAVANVTLTESDEGLFDHEVIRFAETDSTSAPAFGIPPLPRVELLIGNGVLGDTWFDHDGTFDAPDLGDYADFTILHELGHAMGLKHGHEQGLFGTNIPDWLGEALTDVDGPILPADKNSIEFTVMTYRSAPGGADQLVAETYGYAQSLMMLDIQALQYMYGANFNTNATDTTYSWDPTTGTMSINGVAQRRPGGADGTAASNRVFMTIWDGNGVDTYDMSNYGTGVSINLAPGQWSITSQDQLADLNGGSRTSGLARGNVANALLYQDDTRSLIENANGGSGSDTLSGNDIANVLTGNGGADTVAGLLGEDTLNGGDGADTLDGGADNDSLSGGAGADSLVGGDGYDEIDGGGDADTALGGAGADTVNGGDGNDSLDGGTGDDQLAGDGGNDTLAGGDGADAIQAGAGDDSADGGVGADSLTGSDGADTLQGGDDNDSIAGDGGDDSLVGGAGDDTVLGGAEHDWLDGGLGADSLDAGADDDIVFGDDGADTILGGDGNDQVFAGIGADTVDGGDGDDSLYGGDDADTMSGGAGLDLMDGGDGADSLDGGADADTLFGGAGNDTLLGGLGADVVTGEAGADSLDGGDDNDTLDGGADSDTIQAGAGDDSATGGAGFDTLYGGDGIDVLRGGDDNDELYGQGGTDSLFGDAGNDTLDGGPGSDTLDGGAGIDMASYGTATGPVVINLQDWSQTTGDAQGDLLISIEQFGLTDYNDLFIGLDDPLSGDVVFGRGGNDTLLGFAGNDSLSGEAGDDSIVGGAGADLIDGGDGFDTTSYLESGIGIVVNLVDPTKNTGIATGDQIVSIEQFHLTIQNDVFVGLDTAERVLAYHGNDLVYANGGNDTVLGGGQQDTLFGGGGDDSMDGELGDDVLDGGDGNDRLVGNDGIDSLIGGAGADSLFGGIGNDRLNGGAGDDLLGGGLGKDVFEFQALGWGDDRILDFEDKTDRIYFSGLASGPGVHAFSDLTVTEQLVMGTWETTIMRTGSTDEIVLVGIRAAQIGHQDFIFA